jgi:hypothetical protein
MPVHAVTDEPAFTHATIADSALETITRRVLGEDFQLQAIRSERFPYRWGSIGTAGLWRVDVDGMSGLGSVSHTYFVKLLRNPRIWPLLHTIPEPLREDFVAIFPWRMEYDMQHAGLAGALPEGVRLPRLHHANVTEDYISLWYEFVDVDPRPWTLSDFGRSAYLLGRMAARRREGAPVNQKLPARCTDAPRTSSLRQYVQQRVLGLEARIVQDTSRWRTPRMLEALAGSGDQQLSVDLPALVRRIPSILDQLERLSQTFVHGDASPQNLLIPAADRSLRVAIDWGGFCTLLPVGFDLGQLLIGLAHAGELEVSELPALQDAVLEAFRSGLAAENFDVPPDEVRFGFLGSLVCRSGLGALPLDPPNQVAPSLTDTELTQRIQLTRYLVNIANSLT